MKGIFNHFKTLNPIVNITASPLPAQSAQSNPTIPALTAPVLWTHHQVRNRSLLMLHTHQTSNAPSHKHAHVIIAWSIKYTHTHKHTTMYRYTVGYSHKDRIVAFALGMESDRRSRLGWHTWHRNSITLSNHLYNFEEKLKLTKTLDNFAHLVVRSNKKNTKRNTI